MTSPSKKEWKNPKDIMKIHRIKRQSSGGITQISKTNISRRNSMSAFSESVKTNGILASKSDSSISSFQNSQKRKNPFSCDSHSSNKRRFSLQVGATETVTNSEKWNTLVETSVCEDADHAVEIETEKQVEHNHQHPVRSLADLEEKDDLSPPNKGESLKTIELMSDENIQNMQQDQPSADYPTLIPSPSPEEHSNLQPNPPLDWSLKTKLRVIVHSLESSYKKIPGIDAKHVHSFIHHNLDNDSSWNSLDVYQKIKRCCLYYSYPHMPWISTFPRMNTDFKSRSTSLVSTNNEVLDSFQKDWSNTFTSVYQQFRSGLCPYFYTCTHQFTVLFRCLRSSNNTSISAILSPSTRGLREMLNREGIGYRMPNIKTQTLKKKTDKNSGKDDENITQRCQPTDSKSDKENVEVNNTGIESDQVSDLPEAKSNEELDDSDDDFDIADHDGASRWLEGMGLNHKDFPSLKPFEVKLQREGYREIDNRPQSMLYVEGVDVHPFFNFLLNYPGCIASSGPQHGFPPTLLSPTPFVGSLLVQNTVKHSILKDRKPFDSKLGATHVFEIMGPLLPHHTLNIASILNTSQEVISASVSHSTYLPSAALNTMAVNTEEKDKLASGLQKLFVDISYAYPGLIEGVKDRMTSPPQVENGMSVKEVAVSKSGFTWSCL